MDQDRQNQPDLEFVKVSTERPIEDAPQPVTPRRLLEVMLNPRTLQGLMLLGGGLLVLGLVVWLWSIGVFENRLIVAGCLGVANAALLACGVVGYRYTRYQTAAKGITILGCLVMPLNLWFYDAQGLVTLDQGGHLWIPALVCCAIYVLVARLLADPLFVHAIVGGITMTGMLFLADRQVGHLWEIIPPSSFLVVLGMICIHLERAFAAGDGAFSRDKFGREFFRAGHLVMSIGLVVLFIGRLCGRFYGPYLMNMGLLEMPAVATEAHLKLISLLLVLCGAWSYLYSHIVVRPQGSYLNSAAIALLWGGAILIDLIAIPLSLATLSLLMTIPLTIVVGSLITKSETIQSTASKVAQLAATLLVSIGVGIDLGFVAATPVSQPHLWAALLFAESTLCFGLASLRRTRPVSLALSALSFCAAVWHLLVHFQITQQAFLFTLAIVGTVLLAAAEIAARRNDQKENSMFTTAALWSGRVCISFGGAATMLMSLARLLTSEAQWVIVGLLAAQALAAVVAVVLSRESAWRRHFVVLATGEVLLSLLAINALSTFSMLQRIELFLTLVGLMLVSFGYLGWYREGEAKQSQVSFNLAFGSMLSAIPLTLGLLVQRFGDSHSVWGWIMLHEVGVLSVGMALLAAGILCRIRWSTLVGSSTLVVYILSLVALIQLPDQLQSTAIYMMVGGGLFFGTAVLLSVYRDRLLALPKRVQEGEGVFQVLKWR